MSATTAAMQLPVASRRFRPRLAIVVTVGAILAVLVAAYIGSNVWASVQQHGLQGRFDAAAARWDAMDPVARSSVTFAPGDPVARLVVSSIGLDVVVVEGATPAMMRRGPGHLIGSATPGENGVAIIAGNRFAFGSYFMRLDRLGVGDTIITQSVFGRTTYTVQEVRLVPADQLDLATDSSTRQLMLFASSRLWGGSDRLVVKASADQDLTP